MRLLCWLYSAAILLLFCCYSAAILLLFCCYSAAICCYSGFIPALFFYAVLYARQQTTTTSTAAATSNSNKTQMTPNSDSATKGTRTDKQTGKGAVVLDHQPARPLSSCVFSAEAEEPVGRLNIPGPSAADRRRALARHARATRSTGRARSRRAQRPRRCPGVWLLFETTTPSLALASPPLASLDLTAIIIPHRRCRVEIHAPTPSQGATSN